MKRATIEDAPYTCPDCCQDRVTPGIVWHSTSVDELPLRCSHPCHEREWVLVTLLPDAVS